MKLHENTMSDSIKQLLDSPLEFLKNVSENSVIVTLVQLLEHNKAGETLLILAKCMRVYPKIWQYVHRYLTKENPPFKPLLQDGIGNEPIPKRRKQGMSKKRLKLYLQVLSIFLCYRFFVGRRNLTGLLCLCYIRRVFSYLVAMA